MTMNFLVFLCLYISSAFMIIGYGQFAKNLLIPNKNDGYEFGFIGLFGFLFLYFISSIIIFFTNINNFISLVVFLLGNILFALFLLKKKYNYKFLVLFISILILFLPLAIIAEPNEDFFFYYQPYINYLQSSKIIFGVVNINSTLAFSTYSLYDIIIFFNLNNIFQSSFSTPILIFYFLYLVFLIEILFKKFSLFYFIVLFLSIVSFNKLRDIGTSVPPQLLLIMISCLIYSLLLDGFKEATFTKILLLLVFAIILRFNSIIVLPLIILIFSKYIKYALSYLDNNKKIIFFSMIVTLLFFSKNVINSGCLVYPVKTVCFEDLFWSSNLEVTEQKYHKLSSDSKGWPFYAKENFDISDKFVWRNLNKEGFYSYNTYLAQSPTLWIKYWIKDPNYKKILNLFFLCIFTLLVTFSFRSGKIDNQYLKSKNFMFFLISIILVIIFWFLVSPQMRYGGYFCFIILFSLIFSSITKFISNNSHKYTLVFLIVASISYVNIKNLQRIYIDFNKNNFLNFPWPNDHELNENIDYIIFTKDDVVYNKRLRTEKLVFDNGDQAILMCGNINFPCIPEGKEVCLGEKLNKNGFIFYRKNKNEDDCYKFMNENILY